MAVSKSAIARGISSFSNLPNARHQQLGRCRQQRARLVRTPREQARARTRGSLASAASPRSAAPTPRHSRSTPWRPAEECAREQTGAQWSLTGCGRVPPGVQQGSAPWTPDSFHAGAGTCQPSTAREEGRPQRRRCQTDGRNTRSASHCEMIYICGTDKGSEDRVTQRMESTHATRVHACRRELVHTICAYVYTHASMDERTFEKLASTRGVSPACSSHAISH